MLYQGEPRNKALLDIATLTLDNPNTMFEGRVKLAQLSNKPYIWFIDDDDVVLDIPKNFEGNDITLYKTMYRGKSSFNEIAMWAKVFRTDIIKNLNPYQINYLEDYLISFLTRNYEKHYVDQVIYKYTGSHYNRKKDEGKVYYQILKDIINRQQ